MAATVSEARARSCVSGNYNHDSGGGGSYGSGCHGGGYGGCRTYQTNAVVKPLQGYKLQQFNRAAVYSFASISVLLERIVCLRQVKRSTAVDNYETPGAVLYKL
ncbi:hypothetical protein Dimus_033035 [Dionaea muscipula]